MATNAGFPRNYTAIDSCSLERVQKDVGHARPSTTQLYDHRDDNPEESATFFATY